MLTTKEFVNDAVTTHGLLLLLHDDTIATPLSGSGVFLLRCLLLVATMTTTQRRRGGVRTTTKTHVSLSLGPLGPVLGLLPSDDEPIHRRLIGDVLGPPLRIPPWFPAGQRRPDDRTTTWSCRIDLIATQRRHQDDAIATRRELQHDATTTTRELLNDDLPTCRRQHDAVATGQRLRSLLKTTCRRRRGNQDKPLVCDP